MRLFCFTLDVCGGAGARREAKLVELPVIFLNPLGLARVDGPASLFTVFPSGFPDECRGCGSLVLRAVFFAFGFASPPLCQVGRQLRHVMRKQLAIETF